jgi:transcriptional regulator with XRE-family HTH domain
LPFCSLTLTAKKPSKSPIDPKTIGEHIKKRRLELGLTQLQLAAILGVAQCTVTNWEKHRSNPTLRSMPKITRFLAYDPVPADSRTLGERLLKYRKSLGVNQKELARRIGIDPTTLSRLERNQGCSFKSVLRKVFAFMSRAVQTEDFSRRT